MAMEFLTTSECNKCMDITKCGRGCALHTGKALIDFLLGIDTCETSIGDYDCRNRGGQTDLVVSGHQIFYMENPAKVLTSIDTAIDISDKFCTAYDKNAYQIATAYCKHIGMIQEDMKNIGSLIKNINSNRLLVMPFKPHTKCKVVIGDASLDKKKDGEITFLKWTTNKETHKLECLIGFNVQAGSNQVVKYNITEYLDKFRLSQMEIKAKSNKHDDRLICMTSHGIFKPILVKDKKNNMAVAIDGSYMYVVNKTETHIIGYWNEREKFTLKRRVNTPALDKIMDNIDFIERHRRYIAPYMLYEANTIEI